MAHVTEDFVVLREYVGAPHSDDDFIDACFHEAEELVDTYISDSSVPTIIRDRAVLECGSELYHRRSAPNGISQFAGFDGAPMRVARDPMVSARPLIDPYRTNPGFA